jgi:hypothetical protein
VADLGGAAFSADELMAMTSAFCQDAGGKMLQEVCRKMQKYPEEQLEANILNPGAGSAFSADELRDMKIAFCQDAGGKMCRRCIQFR